MKLIIQAEKVYAVALNDFESVIYFCNFCCFAAGTQTSGDSSRMEFAQEGFSTAFTSSVNNMWFYQILKMNIFRQSEWS